jgi:hypothetical protein
MHTKIWPEILKGSDHLEDLGIDRRIIIKIQSEETGFEGVDWIYLDRN